MSAIKIKAMLVFILGVLIACSNAWAVVPDSQSPLPGAALVFPTVAYASIIRPAEICQKCPAVNTRLTPWLENRELNVPHDDLTRSRLFLLRPAGLSLTDIEQITYVVYKLTPSELDPALRMRVGPTVDAYTVRFNQPLKRTVILDLFAQMKVKQFANVTYFGNDEPFGPALHFLDDRTFILSNQVLLQQIIQAPEPPSAARDLLIQIATSAQAAFVWDAAQLARVMEKLTVDEKIKAAIVQLANFLEGHQSGSVKFDPEVRITFRLQSKDEAGAKQCEQLLREYRATLSQLLSRPMGTAIGARISQLIDFEQVTISRQGTGMNVELPLKIAPADMDDLLSKLIPTSPSRMQIEGEEDATVAAIRRIIPRDLAADIAAVDALMSSPRRPNHSDATTVKLSPSAVVAFDEFLSEEKEVAKYPEWFRDFRVHASMPLGHTQVYNRYFKSYWLGYLSMIQHHHIKKITADAVGDKATGQFEFDVPGSYAGRLNYEAERQDDSWRITRFEFPARKWVYLRAGDAEWTCSTAFGDGTMGFRNSVSCHGVASYQGKPAAGLKLVLRNAIFHDVFAYVSVDDNGKFETGYKLPPGRYRVSVEEQGDRVKVPEIYRSIATSELIVDLDQKGSPLSVMFQNSP